MLTFLRRIRKGLLADGRTRRYLVYALGEILLVMIGILLALQVSNWNEKRLEVREEGEILQALKGEFSSNEYIIETCILDLDTMAFFMDSIRTYLGPDEAELEDSTLLIWFGFVGSTTRCFPNTDVLKDLTSSGKMAIIRDDSIRLLVGQWSSQFEDLKTEVAAWDDEFSSIFYPYTYKWISWDDVDYYSSSSTPKLPFLIRTPFDPNPKQILQEFEFQNVLSIHYWRVRRIRYRERDLLEKTREILVKISTAVDELN